MIETYLMNNKIQFFRKLFKGRVERGMYMSTYTHTHLLAHASNDCNGQGWASLEPGTQTCSWIYWVSSSIHSLEVIFHCLHRQRSWVGRQAAKTQGTSARVWCRHCRRCLNPQHFQVNFSVVYFNVIEKWPKIPLEVRS